MDMTLPELVRAQIRVRPEAPAVSASGARITYRELDDWSDAVARKLMACGITTGDRVAVTARRSLAYPAAVLGVLKAGAVYVPVDRSYPAERQRFLLADAAVAALVTWEDDEGPPNLPVIRIGASPQSAEGPELPDTREDDLAYVMYTSGSTGSPKGVMVEHRQIVDLVSADERLHVRPGERVAMLAPVSFDASTFELWNTLCRGGELVVLPEEAFSVAELSAWLRDFSPDWIFLTTGLFHTLVDHEPDALKSVGRLITGGDVLSTRHLRTAAGYVRHAVYAAYGPTETTTFATLHRIDPSKIDGSAPLGTPLSGTEIHLLDRELQPIAAGEVGEICIGGPGVARGYLGQPELTAERFVTDPRTGHRLYRSGDLGGWRPDGVLEFHGRKDRQVKIRGHRVEPNEIESHLSEHPGVGSALVEAVEDASGSKRLVAYIVPARGAMPAQDRLRQWITDRLPAYMEPATIVLLESAPLDANGKPDRARLPYPFTRRDELPGLPDYFEPDTDVERQIATAMAEALDLDRVGMDDNFNLLGGDSLRSMDVLAKLRAAGVEVPAREFFGTPTPAALARVWHDIAGQ
ncbi:amino acid adenylation domain-containing protein [Kibdelosporangium aridum]|uniref:Amino acid adenylation domain-containing protein n=1 Tax=Kibdelosporangium aridum TaxID=2030 RepID=A0A428ZD34_KIBAR|nr:non-ribosomal peptide synthetase [Kibdelosporangium aridum]RSM85956.1 amino acid adenylation domain-containing protein [Kibdelosporangium aridum]